MRQTKSGRQWKAGIFLGVALSVLPVWAYALGLGRLVVHSSLDEPLNAEIELIDPTPQELQSLSPSLASSSDFDQAGIDRPDFLTEIKYKIAQHPDGGYFIKLSTDSPIREPFIHTLLQVDWAGGHLVREYTALMDPPHWVAGARPEVEAPSEAEADTETAPAPSAAPQAEAPVAAETASPTAADQTAPESPAPAEAASAPAEASTAPQAVAEAAPAEPETPASDELLGPPGSDTTTAAAPEAAPVAPSAVAASSWARTTRYTVKKGDTLMGISRKLNGDRKISPQQVMIALLRANPKAFFDHNINNLKSGRILRVPDRKAVEAVSETTAAKEVGVQYDAWQEYKLRLAAASRTVAVPKAAAPSAKSTIKGAVSKQPQKPAQSQKPAQVAAQEKPQPQNAAAATAAAPVATDQDLLRIVRANLDESSSSGGAKAAGPATAKTQAAGESRGLPSKVATLEEQIDAKQLENKELSERVGKMQKQVKNTERLIDIENKELALTQNEASKPAATTPAKTATPPATAPKAAAPAKVAPKPVVRRPPFKRPIVQPPAPVQESPGLLQSVIDSITGNSFTLALLGGVGVLGIGILSVYYLRRRRAKAEFEESILSGGSLNTDGASISDSGSQAAASDTSFLSDFSQGGMGNIHTDEVDPIAEAEVYLAYGRDEQAEEILKEAVVKDPQRLELKQKLLEIYHQRNDVGAFETMAEELYAQVEGKGGKVWEKVEEMGRKISPNNPMFRGGAPGAKSGMAMPAARPAAMPKAEPHATGPLGESPAALTPSEPMVAAAPAASLAADTGLNFDIGTPVASPGEVNFDMDLASALGSAEPASAVATASETAGASADTGFDLDFNLGDSSVESNAINFDSAATSDSEPALDFGTTATAEAAHANEGIAFTTDSAAETPVLEFENDADTGGENASAGQSQWDETATKLDLAKAYIDMGDADGARSILDEVMSEGNESQKNQARELAAQIA